MTEHDMKSLSREVLADKTVQLEAEVDRLKQALGDLHATEVNALRRAYKTMCQHVEALEQESSGLLKQVHSLELDLVTPETIAAELGAFSVTAVSLSVAHQCLQLTPLAGARWLVKGMWVAGGAYIFWRLTAGTLSRLASMLSSNRERRRRLEAQLAVLEDRITIMGALLQWAPTPATPSPADPPQPHPSFNPKGPFSLGEAPAMEWLTEGGTEHAEHALVDTGGAPCPVGVVAGSEGSWEMEEGLPPAHTWQGCLQGEAELLHRSREGDGEDGGAQEPLGGGLCMQEPAVTGSSGPPLPAEPAVDAVAGIEAGRGALSPQAKAASESPRGYAGVFIEKESDTQISTFRSSSRSPDISVEMESLRQYAQLGSSHASSFGGR